MKPPESHSGPHRDHHRTPSPAHRDNGLSHSVRVMRHMYSLMDGSLSGHTCEERYVKPSGRYDVGGASLSLRLKSYE